MPLPRVALISHSYVEAEYRKKMVHMLAGADLLHVTPSFYPTAYGFYAADPQQNDGLKIMSFRPRFIGKQSSTRWALQSWDLGFRRFSPDIIHVENEMHSWIVCQALLCRALFAPHAKMVTSLWTNQESRGFKGRLLEVLGAFNRHFIDFLTCANAAGREILLRHGVPPERVRVVPLAGVDVDHFQPYPSEQRQQCRDSIGLRPGEFAVGFVGRFVEEKGILDLVDALAAMVSSGLPATLVVVGKGELESAIRQECAGRDVRLIVVPARRYQQVPEVMNTFDVLVLPSRTRPYWAEQFGRVLIEAMACGVPVIGSDSGDIPNVIADSGFIFPEGDARRLSELLARCCKDSALRADLSRRGMERVARTYSNESVARQTLAVYETVLGRPLVNAGREFLGSQDQPARR
jgi:glycosyltransferase involved in cell wall biosynthesis